MIEQAPALLWTAVPIEVVFEAASPAPRCVHVAVAGRTLLVQPRSDGTGMIERLISSDPQDYLDPRWQPGTVLPLHAH